MIDVNDQLHEMKMRACRAHALCNELRIAHPDIPELSDDGTLHEAIHDILRVDTPTAAPAMAEREAAKGGVTDDVVDKALQAYFAPALHILSALRSRAVYARNMRAALEAVWPGQAQQGEPVAPEVPAGWKLVPITLTEGMRKAHDNTVEPGSGGDWYADDCWQAMLDAAPQSPSSASVAWQMGDREALHYLMKQFDHETWQCPQCGHAEDTATMDSADYLRQYLKEHPIAAPQPEGG